MGLATIALGGNLHTALGSPEETVRAAAQRVASLGAKVKMSSLYRTRPVGYAEQPWFVNAVMQMETRLSAFELMRQLLRVEAEFGRDRNAGVTNGPRTLDVDLLLYDGEMIDTAELKLPHPRMHERAFVLVPLAEIAPEMVYPTDGHSVRALLAEISEEELADCVMISAC
uniref:2-amino-4-hydroxy-6-hydroxymethyldihydropteridine diphosphokinase n=1 Tax=mine drainage metagenome TaxID=410659 RepID=E6PZ25_9ZZZZ